MGQQLAIVLIGVGAVFVLGILVLIARTWRQVDQGYAMIVNKMGNEPKVTFTGAIVLPIVNRAEIMDLSVKTIHVARRGKDGLIWHFENLAREYPGKRLAIKRALAEGNHVTVHRWSKLPALLGDTEFMAIDIFRLDDDGKIVEHWDVQQRIPRSSTNRNSIF